MSGKNKVVSIAHKLQKAPDPLELAAQLSIPVRLKTWSLIVTFFGDVILPRGGAISALSLGQVIEAAGVEAGAIRTAVSRLASDGWIERERRGRASFYRLASFREQAFKNAARLIYAPSGSLDKCNDWAIGLLPGDLSLPAGLEKHSISLQKGWLLLDMSEINSADLPSALMIFQGNFLQKPAWFLEQLAPEELGISMERLLDVFSPVWTALQNNWKPAPLEALAIRCLLIHEWRRIALRLNKLPGELLPDDWPEERCRKLTGDLYLKLFPISEKWLDTEAFVQSGNLPRIDPSALTRFR